MWTELRTEERLFFKKKVLSWRRYSILSRENFAFFVIFLSMAKIFIADKETGFFINLRRFNISLPNSRKSSVAKKPPLQNHGISARILRVRFQEFAFWKRIAWTRNRKENFRFQCRCTVFPYCPHGYGFKGMRSQNFSL